MYLIAVLSVPGRLQELTFQDMIGNVRVEPVDAMIDVPSRNMCQEGYRLDLNGVCKEVFFT